MFTIHLAIRRTAWKNTRRAKLHFVDLAGWVSQRRNETLATCRFAQRVALVKNEATLNEDRDPMQEVSVLKAEVKRLKDQIRLLSNDKHYVDGHLSPAEETECRELVDAFLENSQTLELPMDLRKIEYCCFLLKEAVVEARRGNNFPKHERGTSQHVEKCMQKLLQQRNNEIAILTELLRKERKHRMNSKSPKRTLSPPGPKPSFDDYQKLIRHAGVSLNKHEQAALKKYAANPSHTNEVDNLKAQLRLRHTAAKKIHDKIEENKARIAFRAQ
ncbi:Uncharacterized protein GBIM_15522 [Gryllus bimaculatus]|nr:Uncharacterized protein GBIM_15522 [Gryllus bimaculatus]